MDLKDFKKITRSEDSECIDLSMYLTMKGIKFSHIAQETPAGSYIYGRWQPNFKSLKRNKAVGVKKGVPDYLIILPPSKRLNSPDKLLFLEMKKETGGVVSIEQREWIKELNKVEGVFASVAKGFDEAVAIIESFL